MSGGKVPVRGGGAWGRLSRKVGIASLKAYRGNTAPLLTCHDARKTDKQIRYAVNLYRLAHGGGAEGEGPQTQTSIRQAVNKVKRNASRALKSNYEEKWLDRLHEALSVNMNLLDALGFSMRRRGIDLVKFHNRHEAAPLSAEHMEVIKALASVDVKTIVPPRGHSDPPLASLVPELMPIWQFVTGTSPYPKNDREGVVKRCPFADWLSEMIFLAGLSRPPQNTIGRLVRLQKKKK